jgi:glycogen(starch) synthase
MRILALTNLYPPHYLGGYELIAYAVLNALRSRRHDVQILTSNHVVPGKEFNLKEEGIERTLQINGFYGHQWHGIWSLRNLEKHNNRTLLEAIKRHRPDAVYVWNMGGLSKSMVFTLQRLGIPTVFYLSDHWIARGFQSDVWLQWWNNPSRKHRLIRAFLRVVGVRRYWQKIAPTNPLKHLKFQRLYFCSKALRKLTASAGFEVMHGAVIYCPVNIRKFHGFARKESDPFQKLLWVGRLAADKGVMTALKAMQLLRGKFPGELRIYGNGDPQYTSTLTEFVADNQLPISFHSAGMDQMPDVYRSHDGLVFTSEWAEPFALTPIEAMASGVPVIGTTTGGSREIFRHCDNALTYTAGKAEELAERILELAGNPLLRARIAAAGQEEVRANYAEELIVDQIEAYLKETIATWTPPRLPNYTA